MKSFTYTVRVEFGDCDPAGIVWFPNFFRWIDAASRHFFVQCGLPPWRELEAERGILGTPLVDTRARFVRTASYGDVLDIETHVGEWRDKSFTLRYRVTRSRPDAAPGQESKVDLIMEAEEVRIFAEHRSDGQNGIRAVPVPADLRALCE